jgi:hypothetical protein
MEKLTVERERSREIGETESAVASDDDDHLAVRARSLRLQEGAGDAGGAGRGADARVMVAAREGSHPVGPVPYATERLEALGGGGLGREGRGQAAEVGFVGAVGRVYATHALEYCCAGGERRDGQDYDDEEDHGMLHSGW